MVSEAYLIINRRGISRLAKRRVTVSNNEIIVKLRITMSQQLFDRLVPVAELNISENQVILPMDVEIDNYSQLQGQPHRQNRQG